MALEKAGPWRTLAVAPKSVLSHWVDEAAIWYPGLRVVEGWGTAAARRAARDEVAGMPERPTMLLLNYEAVRQDVEELAAITWGAMVVDECHPAGTSISTPTGDVAIEDLGRGDPVLSVDASGNVVIAQVTHIFERETDEGIWALGETLMTPHHPVWTTRGYVPVGELKDGDEVLRMVRWPNAEGSAVSGCQAAVLLQEVLDHRQGHAGITREVTPVDAQGDSATGSTGEITSTSRWPRQSAQGPGSSGSSERLQQGGGVPRSQEPRRERGTPNRAAAEAGRGIGVGDGGSSADGHGEAVWVSTLLQVGYRSSDSRRGDRGGWEEPPQQITPSAGREKRHPSSVPGLDRISLLEPGGSRAPGRDRRVHNIETSVGNYFAGGLLVHNSHRLKGRSTQVTRAVNRLVKHPRMWLWLLTGTPLPNRPTEAWSLLHLIDRSRFSSYWRWVESYCELEPLYARRGPRTHFQPRVVTGLKSGAEEAIRAQLADVLLYRTLEELLPDLPEATIIPIFVELDAEERRVYRELVKKAWSTLPDGTTLRTMNEIARMTRLRQIVSSMDALGAGRDRPGSKVAAAVELCADLEPAQVVVLTWSRAAAERVAAETGGAFIHGGVEGAERAAIMAGFADGSVRVLAGTISTLGEGVDGMQVAHHLVRLDRSWVPSQNEQSLARIRRSGQRHDAVFCWDLVARSTIDETIEAALAAKESVIDALLATPASAGDL